MELQDMLTPRGVPLVIEVCAEELLDTIRNDLQRGLDPIEFMARHVEKYDPLFLDSVRGASLYLPDVDNASLEAGALLGSELRTLAQQQHALNVAAKNAQAYGNVRDLIPSFYLKAVNPYLMRLVGRVAQPATTMPALDVNLLLNTALTSLSTRLEEPDFNTVRQVIERTYEGVMGIIRKSRTRKPASQIEAKVQLEERGEPFTDPIDDSDSARRYLTTLGDADQIKPVVTFIARQANALRESGQEIFHLQHQLEEVRAQYAKSNAKQLLAEQEEKQRSMYAPENSGPQLDEIETWEIVH